MVVIEKLSLIHIYIHINEFENFDDVLREEILMFFPEQKYAETKGMLFEINDTAYVETDGTLMIPLRAFLELMNGIGNVEYKLGWNDKSKTCLLYTSRCV